MLRIRHALPVAGLLAATVPAFAGPPGDTSWGKPNVSLEQFAEDANGCADTSRLATVSIKPETLKALDALSSAQLLQMAMDGQANGPSPFSNPATFAANISETRSETDIARRSNTFGARFVASTSEDVSGELQAVLNRCLTDRGYVRIRLTDEQRRALSHLKHRSAARTAYLHAIDSDPVLIARQRLAPAPSSAP